MSRLAALLFDVDGTIADTEKAHLEAFNQAFQRAGLPWRWSVPLYVELLAVTGGKERIRHYIDHHLRAFSPPYAIDRFIADLHREKTRVYVDLTEQGHLGLRPGVQRLLREARDAGLRLAIATTTTPANVSALLESALGPGGTGWFEYIGAGDVVPRKKPAPDIYHHVLEQLVLDPGECLAFEDSQGGLRAATEAGLATVVTVNDFTLHHDFRGAALVLDHLGEPYRPFQVLAGDAGGKRYVDVDLLRRVHAGARGGNDPP
jgi:beta-phosphoglucomutase-like phosphatase (HAD superfamily)